MSVVLIVICDYCCAHSTSMKYEAIVDRFSTKLVAIVIGHFEQLDCFDRMNEGQGTIAKE